MLEVCETTIGRLRIDPTRLRTDGWRNDSLAKRTVSGESSDDGNESSNSSSFSNKESPVAISDLDLECEISHEGHDDIQHER